MRSTVAFASCFLAVVVGCATSGGGGGDTGGGSGSSDQNDNQSGDPNANDNADDSDDLPIAFRLDGTWDDNDRPIVIEQDGVEVVAIYSFAYICDLDSGPVPLSEVPAPEANTDSTFFSFSGTLNNGEDVLPGDKITGETSICLYGSPSGIVLAEITLTVIDEDSISGDWEFDEDGDGEPEYTGSVALTREQ